MKHHPGVLMLAMWLSLAPAFAQDNEQARYYVQQMIEMAAANDDKGVQALQRMLEQQHPRTAPANPTQAAAAQQRGLDALQQSELDAALRAFQQATQDDPGNAEAFSNLGLVYRKLSRLSDAERALLQALTLEPGRAAAWFQLAQIYALRNDAHRTLGALANTYRFANNPMRAEEILRYIAETEAAETLRSAALLTLRLYNLPAEPTLVPPTPVPANSAIKPLRGSSAPTAIAPHSP
ncbi:MAG: tetratricopeptide repeat protein [Candidatus Competibacteraceae bacterium]